jgi:hypothetical protein
MAPKLVIRREMRATSARAQGTGPPPMHACKCGWYIWLEVTTHSVVPY